jgi:hypothetical protein
MIPGGKSVVTELVILSVVVTLGIPDQLETLEQFFQRHSQFCRPISKVSFYDSEQVQLSREKNSPKIDIKSLDNLLGIAGFRPEKSLGRTVDLEETRKTNQKFRKTKFGKKSWTT